MRVHPVISLSLLLSVCLFGAVSVRGEETAPDPLTAYRGHVVLVDFWASWCGPCLRSFPWLNEIQSRYSERGLVVVGVNLDESRSDALKFIDRLKPEFDIIYDDEAALAHVFDVKTMPSSFLLNAGGEIVHEHQGFNTGSAPEFEQVIIRVLDVHQAAFTRADEEQRP